MILNESPVTRCKDRGVMETLNERCLELHLLEVPKKIITDSHLVECRSSMAQMYQQHAKERGKHSVHGEDV